MSRQYACYWNAFFLKGQCLGKWPSPLAALLSEQPWPSAEMLLALCILIIVLSMWYPNSIRFCFYRPQRSCGKEMFLHLSVILFTGQGVWADTASGRQPPRQTTPSPPDIHPPWAYTLRRWLLQRTVRILPECILVVGRIFMEGSELTKFTQDMHSISGQFKSSVLVKKMIDGVFPYFLTILDKEKENAF